MSCPGNTNQYCEGTTLHRDSSQIKHTRVDKLWSVGRGVSEGGGNKACKDSQYVLFYKNFCNFYIADNPQTSTNLQSTIYNLERRKAEKSLILHLTGGFEGIQAMLTIIYYLLFS